MRKIIVSTFISMDGVMQAPGAPLEDTTQHFKFGGWTFPLWDDIMNEAMGRLMNAPFDLLLGRRTYEIFAAYWPYQQGSPIAELFNRVTKYVVATTPIDTSWQNTTLVNTDVVNELEKLKQQGGPDLFVNGSGRLVQTLLQHKLVDELHTWTFPVTLGNGKKLFAEGTQATQWKMTASTVSTTGVVIASFIPDGDVQVGSFVEEPSEAEIARRKKFAAEG